MMRHKDPTPRRKTPWLLAAFALAASIVFLYFQFPPDEEPLKQATPASKQDVVRIPLKDQPIIDYDKLQGDAGLEQLMAERKAEFGLDEGVDFIVKADEALKIGDETVAMREILEKIKLQKGDIIEKELSETLDLEALHEKRAERIRELSALDARHRQLEKSMAGTTDETKRKALASELAANADVVDRFRQYANVLRAMEEERKIIDEGPEQLRSSASERLYSLRMQKNQLEKELKIPRAPSDSSVAYGIYIVRDNDNIWNIHFQFLRDYFIHRGIEVAPKSDEPDRHGFSSGVGKILKFSENMVYIYNLRDRTLDMDIHLLEPMSKIVVFNMAEVFSLLDPIDFTQVHRVRFDGETLWIPARQEESGQ